MQRLGMQLLFFALGVAAFPGCGLVDEDLSGCGTDYNLDYELRMVTNMTTEIQTQLSMTTDVQISQTLQQYLSGVFTDYAHDVDLGFYDVVPDPSGRGDSLRLHHESHIMDANQSSYTLYIPRRRYMHLAIANVDGNEAVTLAADDRCHSARLMQHAGDTVASHRTGLFTARLEMNIREDLKEDQTFDVNLFMTNCATSLVLDTLGTGIRDIRAYATGFASGFRICDSVYVFRPKPPVVVADRVDAESDGVVCFATVNFPSADPKPIPSRTIIETEDPFVSEEATDPIWRYDIYTWMSDGSVTKSELGVMTPLRAGQLKIIRAKVLTNGAVQPGDPTIGVSIQTDWNNGQEYPEVPL